MSSCEICPYKIACELMPKHQPIQILIDCKLYKECNELNNLQPHKPYIGKVKRGCKILKKILKYKYPQYTWSVVGSHFSMGNDINIAYYDQNYLTETIESNAYLKSKELETLEIEKICNLFQEGHYDGQSESYNYSNESLLASSKYVFARRKPLKERRI